MFPFFPKMVSMLVTRRLEFDAGHRIPDHKSQCRHLHGHRYALEITLSGNIIAQDGDPANGMVMDFSEIKSLAQQHLVDHWDHSFLVYAGAVSYTHLDVYKRQVLMSSPITLRSMAGKSLNHSRTGSAPASVRKNRTSRTGFMCRIVSFVIRSHK